MRLSIEKDILDSKLNGVTWTNPTSAGKTQVEWRVNTNNGMSYTLRVYIPENFPDACPKLVISHSSHGSPLKKKSGSVFGPSHEDHTYCPHEGFTQICHFHPNQWSNVNTLCQILLKGRIWLEAYELHRNTGTPISSYLLNMG